MKRALITSGGGAKGAFTVGALKHLQNQNLHQFDIISGTSTGSLIAALAAAGKIDLLKTIYASVQNDDILKKQNITFNLLNKRPFIFDTEPLRELIDIHITDQVFQTINQSNTILCLTAINLQTGMPTVFSNKNIRATANYASKRFASLGSFKEALLASSSQAGFLPPVTISGQQFVDGGNREVIPTRVAVNLLPDEVVVISNNPNQLFQVPDKYDDLLKILLRAISIFLQDVRENDLAVLRDFRSMTGAKVIHILPEEDLDPEFPTGLRFKQTLMASWIAKGELRAKHALRQGPFV